MSKKQEARGKKQEAGSRKQNSPLKKGWLPDEYRGDGVLGSGRSPDLPNAENGKWRLRD